MFEAVIAEMSHLEALWAYNIRENPDDPRWGVWRDEYIGYNIGGKAKTFALLASNEAVGEVTLILDPSCKAVRGRPQLCDGKWVGNVNALRIRDEFQGRGLASVLVRKMEEEARKIGLSALTIGVEASESRNLAMYLHWGYTRFVFSETDEGELVLYYQKDL